MKKIIFGLFLTVFMAAPSFANDIYTGTAFVNVTSDTAATAKNMAMEEARVQIIKEVLSKQVKDQAAFNELMKKTQAKDLLPLVLRTNIEGERLSSTTYSANIKMSLDRIAAKKWLDEASVPNWIADDSVAADKVLVFVDITNGLRDVIEFNRVLREKSITYDMRQISGGNLSILIPKDSMASFKSSVVAGGWKADNTETGLRVWR